MTYIKTLLFRKVTQDQVIHVTGEFGRALRPQIVV